jgi:hypothetical protein
MGKKRLENFKDFLDVVLFLCGIDGYGDKLDDYNKIKPIINVS